MLPRVPLAKQAARRRSARCGDVRCASATPKAKTGATWRVIINTSHPSQVRRSGQPVDVAKTPDQGKATNCVSNSDFLDRPSF